MSDRHPTNDPPTPFAIGSEPLERLRYLLTVMSNLEPTKHSWSEMIALCDDIKARHYLSSFVADCAWLWTLQRFGQHDEGCPVRPSDVPYPPEGVEACTCEFRQALDDADANAHLIQILVDATFRVFYDINIPIRGGGSIRNDVDRVWEPLRQTLVLIRGITTKTAANPPPRVRWEEGDPPPLRWHSLVR